MEVERKRLEEIMVALSLCLMGKDEMKLHDEVAKRAKELKKEKN
jgi:hypothetical protein